jgi:hemoglobin
VGNASRADLGATPFSLLGGEEPLRRLCARFYAIMSENPDFAGIRAMHGADLTIVTERLTGFLRAWLGGPRDYFAAGDRPCIMSLHRALPIGAAERDQWLACMDQALAETDAPVALKAPLAQAFARMADAMRSR